jgi:hypothetical protein
MRKSPRGRSQWVALLAGPVLALIAFVVAYYVDPLDFGGHSALASLPAFLLAVVVLMIAQNLASLQEIERAATFSDRIYEAVRDYLHVTKVGSPETAFDYVLGRMPILEEVRNTTLNLPDELERSDEKLYETDTYLDAARRIAEWTAKGLRWKDIGDVRAAARLRATHDLAVRTAGRRRSGYQFRLLGRNEPQINFILLSYPDGVTEVLFNWDFRSLGEDPTVLLSRDRDVVQMFAVQFEHLWRYSSPDHDSTAVRSTS